MTYKKLENMYLPSQGFIFWPVGTGDSTSIVVNDDVFIQVDLRHLSSANELNDPHAPIIDQLVELLPKVNDKPYLSAFVLTHPDQDHCLGFTDLLEQVKIGELWFTPRIFREYSKDLCDDAKAFRKEAKRRVKEMILMNGKVGTGDRERIVGYDEILKEEEFNGFPAEYLTIPGNLIIEIDGENYSDIFSAFVHAPFKDDSAGERNDTSLGMQIKLNRGEATARALLLGDLCYPTIKRIFDLSDNDDLKWNVLLTPHQCSKSVMYWKNEDEENESLKQDILDSIQNAAENPGYIIASCEPIPSTNITGDNPPHAKAKNRYEEIAPDGFICTQEHPNSENPEPIVFVLNDKGFEYIKAKGDKKDLKKGLSEAVATARGSNEPPTERVGFGKR